MATILEISAETRQRSGTAPMGRLRKEGLVPAVVYGRNHDNTNVKINAKAFFNLIKDQESDNLLVNLQIDGDKNQLALIQDIQHDHLKGGILHVDFHAVDMDETINASVPLHFVGEAEGVKAGGQMDIMLHNIPVVCTPKTLPDRIDVDLTPIGVGSSIHVGDLKLPEGVKTKFNSSVIILSISTPRVVETPAQAAAAKKK
jgi:large subunit ribosomal protein L25